MSTPCGARTRARTRKPSRPERPELLLDVVHDAGNWAVIGDAEACALAAADAVGRHCGRLKGRAGACLALSDDTRVRELNRTFRGHDKPTNVLSFPAPDEMAATGAVRQLGDIVLAAETVLREAGELGVPPRHHLQHLVVHGLLHLLGLDHETDAEAEEMEAMEIAILAMLGIPDPYAGAARLDAD